MDSAEQHKAAAHAVANKAPHWAAITIVVALFLFYMDRSAKTNELLATQRINTCHRVQEESNEIIGRLADALQEWKTEEAVLKSEMREFRQTLDKHTDVIERLIKALER